MEPRSSISTRFFGKPIFPTRYKFAEYDGRCPWALRLSGAEIGRFDNMLYAIYADEGEDPFLGYPDPPRIDHFTWKWYGWGVVGEQSVSPTSRTIQGQGQMTFGLKYGETPRSPAENE